MAAGEERQVMEAIPSNLADVGIRTHQLRIMPKPDVSLSNTFPCWLASTSETPHRMTLFLKLNSAPENSQDFVLQFLGKSIQVIFQPK
jgi:ABC-type sulfate/molybdate transport systems ATPase subunit